MLLNNRPHLTESAAKETPLLTPVLLVGGMMTETAHVQATNPIAKAGGFPKEAARFIQDTDANVGNAVLHARNQTVWCWSPQDTASIFGEEFLGSSESSFMRSAGDSFAADSSDTSQAGGNAANTSTTLPVWGRWVIAICALLVPIAYTRVIWNVSHCFVLL